MNESQVDVIQLQKRDPQAWTVLLSSQRELQDVIVTAVVAQPLTKERGPSYETDHLTRYLVSLANHSDPVPFISKKTTSTEALFYRDISDKLPSISPFCWYSHLSENEAWIILDDVPNATRPISWFSGDVEEILHQLAMLHTTFWKRQNLNQQYDWLPHFIGRQEKRFAWDELENAYSIYIKQGPGAYLSEHALKHVGRLAPKFLEAANGLAVLKALNGWPGVLGESHLAAAADLIDDPVPMLEPLRQLPLTLLHGSLDVEHCQATLFDDYRFLDWRQAALGPGICDLIYFQESLGFAYSKQNDKVHQFQKRPPITEETIIDSYILTMKTQLGSLFDARQVRMAIPAARCLYVLIHLLPQFASWFDKMPNKFAWQKINRISHLDFEQSHIKAATGLASHFKKVFQRFLQSYHRL